MQRKIEYANIVIQFDNPHVPPQWNAPAILTTTAAVVDDKNVMKFNPTQRVEPATPEDFNDELMVLLNVKLAELGLQVIRKE